MVYRIINVFLLLKYLNAVFFAFKIFKRCIFDSLSGHKRNLTYLFNIYRIIGIYVKMFLYLCLEKFSRTTYNYKGYGL